MANTTDQQLSSIYHNGYTYSVGDTIKISSNWYANSYQSQPGNDITQYLSSTVFQITTIYNQDYAHWSDTYYPDNPITVKIVSSNSTIVGQTGCIQLAQIVPGSGGKPDTYTVSFNANGGSGAPGAQTKTYGVTLTLSSTKPTRSGYEFIGWGSSTSDTSVDYNAGDSYTVNAGTTLYAIWKKTITLSYNANGGSGAPGSQSATVYNATTSNKFTISSTKPTRTGYTFAGWSTSNTATSSSYNSGGSITLSSSDTLYAVWTEHYLTVNYYSNNATSYNGTSTALNTVNNNNVLIWTQKYYYSTYYKDGLNDYSSGSTLGMVRTGYSSTGNWGTSTSGGYLISQNTGITGESLAQALGKTLASGNASVNVYAQWAANTYTIAYNGNGHTSGSTANSSHTWGVAKNLTANGFVKTGYDFAGWGEGTSDGVKYTDKQSVSNLTSDNGGTVTLFAKWEAKTFAVTFDANGGSVGTASITVTYDSTYGTLPIPTRAGYKFLGWYTAKSDGTQITSSTKVTITAAQTLYAHWEPMNVAYYNNNGTYVLCNTYGKVNGQWQPMLLYGKINGAWVRSVTDE